jgi:phenylalanyl-tRNA synthetase beta chain
MRPVSNAVDASNYVMLEMGKPIHVFDAASVSGGTIIVRPAKDGETIETLDHVTRTLTPDTLLIADAGGPLGIAGVMGGAHSEVSPQTTAAIVESAIFDPVSIRRTAFRYGLRSEASLRFEKGQESRLARLGADRTAQLLAEWAGGRPAIGAVDTNPVDEEPRRVAYRPARVNRLLGSELEEAEMRDALGRVEIATEAAQSDGGLVAVVPAHRRDIEIEEDVIEEICRVRGYEELTPQLPASRMPSYRSDPRRFEDTLRDLLSGRGLAEVVTHGLIAPEDHAQLGYAADDSGTIRVANPVTVDHSELRRSMLPGLLGVLARNERQRWPNVAIYECGSLHEWRDGGPAEERVVALLLAGDWRTASWAEAARPAGLDDLKGLIEATLRRMGIDGVTYRDREPRPGIEHPGRSASITVDRDGKDLTVGLVFEVHPTLLTACEVRAEHVAFAILEFDALKSVAPLIPPQVRTIDRLPALERDLAVIVARDVEAARVADVIRDNAGARLAGLELFDRYQGPPLAEREISLAYRLRFQPGDEAMSEAEVEAIIDAVSSALAQRVSGRIRSGS